MEIISALDQNFKFRFLRKEISKDFETLWAIE